MEGEAMPTAGLEGALSAEPVASRGVANPLQGIWHGLQRTADYYFKPHFFEKNGKLYEAIGVKLFSRYCPTAGSIWRRKKNSKGETTVRMSYRGKTPRERLIRDSKRIEAAHTVIGLPLALAAASYVVTADYVPAAVFGLMAFGLNFYPIISQRYNRNRALQSVERYERRAG